MEFRSDRLWSDYIEWEVAANNMSKAMAIFDRLLLVPTQMYSQHFDKSVFFNYFFYNVFFFRCQDFVNTNPPDKILPEDEYDMLYKEIKLVMDDKCRQVYVGKLRFLQH
jgi:hypothetical protein